MKFDVVIGNPPYQIGVVSENQAEDSLAKATAIPIYQKFVTQAKKINPEYLTMIIPARWFAGGRGLDEFRTEMLTDTKIKVLHDFFDSTDCFPGVDISGGICYFLRDKKHNSKCKFISHKHNQLTSIERDLSEYGDDKFVRFNEALSILYKVKKYKEDTIDMFMSSQNPFGFGTNFRYFKNEPFDNALKLYAYPKNGWIDRSIVITNQDIISKYKVFIANAYGERGKFPYLVLGKPFIGYQNEISTATYKVMKSFDTLKEAENFILYVKSKFFRFLVLLLKNTQHAPRKVYQFVPQQNFNESWTDEKLYKKYDLTQEEIDFIESMVRPME